MMTIHSIEPHMVDLIWPNVESEIARACEHSNGELSPDGVLKDLNEKRLKLVLMRKDGEIVAVMTLKIEQFETGKRVLTALTVGGHDIDSWVNEIDNTLNEICKEEGCEEMYIVGRLGWVRKLKKLGYNRIHTTVAKKVA